MSKDPEDLELEALQRQLDDAFETTRPRRGFEDELWARMQRRRPFSERVGDLFGGLIAGFREAPMVPLGTLALLLIVVVGIGVVGPNLIHFSHNSASSANLPEAGGASKGDFYAPGGKVPTPVLHPGLVAPLPQGVQAPDASLFSAPKNLYFGPANLKWTGSFPSDSASAPVFIYAEPSPQQRAASVNVGFVPGQGQVRIDTFGSLAQLPREPVFVITQLNARAPEGEDPVEAADNVIAPYDLLPPWPFNLVVVQSGSVTRVTYQRAFSLPNGGTAFLVDWNGDRKGIEVDIVAGRGTATGPLPLALQSVSLPLIGNDQAAQLAVAQAPASSQAISPTPTVNLDKVELVYALAVAGADGFYEPAYLFTGQFAYNGQIYVKRVLVPLVAASSRS